MLATGYPIKKLLVQGFKGGNIIIENKIKTEKIKLKCENEGKVIIITT